MVRRGHIWRLALASTRCLPGAVGENVATHARWVKRATRDGATFIGFPECSLTGYRLEARFALRRGDPALGAMADLAREHHCHLAAGFIERDGRSFFNSCALFGPRGLVGVARKLNLTQGEARFFRRGTGITALPVNGHRVGLAICADATYFETIRTLGLAGAELVFAPHATFLEGTRSSWVKWRLGRWPFFARESCCLLAGCNQAGLGLPRDFAGGALAVGANGGVLARLGGRGNAEGGLRVDADLAAPLRLRPHSVNYTQFQARLFYHPKLLNPTHP